MGLGPPCVRKGTHQNSLGGRERRRAGPQVLEALETQDAPCGARPAATAAPAPGGLPAGCMPRPGAAASSAAPGLGWRRAGRKGMYVWGWGG